MMFSLAGDDHWEAWVDGVYLDSHLGWNHVGDYNFTLDSGVHVLTVLITDVELIINGFIAKVEIDGESAVLTGDSSWRVSRE